MSGPATGTASPGSPGVLEIAAFPPHPHPLKPQALLQRLRPLRLAVLARVLHEYERYSLSRRLVESLFPGRMQNWASTRWWEVLHYLVCLVEEFEWFEIAWDVLNDAYRLWMETYDEEGADEYLAAYLHYIPVQLFGFNAEDSFSYPPENWVYELFWVLLKPKVTPTCPDVLIEAELYDMIEAWTDRDRAMVWQRLEAIAADPGQYPEPLRALPVVARWVCGCTGNILLDQCFQPYQDRPRFSWDEDLERVRQAYQCARPVLDYGHRLEQWYQNDSSNLSKLAHFLIEGTNYDEFDW
jgi:hypothetical protein